jgi:replication-associated recombination protein RarA
MKALINVAKVRDNVRTRRSQHMPDFVRKAPAKRKEDYLERHPLYPHLIVDTRTSEQAMLTATLEDYRTKRSRKERIEIRKRVERLGRDKDGAYRAFDRIDGKG